jgi:peptide deformylase
MAKLKIYTFPDLVLAQKAAPIARVERNYFKLADDMLETMYYAPGIGLAANQVGILERILVLDTEYDLVELEEGEKAPEGAEVVGGALIQGKKPKIIINPEIIEREGKIAIAEGCLSVPDYSAEVQRSEKIKLQYQDIDGVTRTLSAEGLMAVAIQHEMDHLEGKLFIDRLSPIKKEVIRKKLRKERIAREEDERDFGPLANVDRSSSSSKKKKGF